jgi:hypothetical protein
VFARWFFRHRGGWWGFVPSILFLVPADVRYFGIDESLTTKKRSDDLDE